jgi:recombinational DNA repair protein RecR
MIPPVNVKTAAQFAFHLRDEEPDEVERLLRQALPQIYGYARRDHGHDEACRFVVEFMDQVVACMHQPSGHS